MANSYLRDLYELDHGSFLSRYGMGSLSMTEFQRLRALAGASAKSQILQCGSTVYTHPADAVTLFQSDLYVLTRMLFVASGTGVISVDMAGLGTIRLDSSGVAGVASFDTGSMEHSFETNQSVIADSISGAAYLTHLFLGYVPVT